MPRRPPLKQGFQKGKSGNPSGSSARAKELKVIRKLSTQQVAEVGTLLLENNRVQLRELAESNDDSFLKVWTAALMLKGYAKANPQIYAVIMDRIIGRPKEHKEITGLDGAPVDIRALEQTDEEKIERAEKLRKLRIELDGGQ